MTNGQLIQTAKEAMRNDTVLNKGIVELLCNALVAVTEQRDAVVVECLSLKSAIIDIEDKYMNWEGLCDAFDAAKTTPTPATDKAISDRENDGGSK